MPPQARDQRWRGRLQGPHPSRIAHRLDGEPVRVAIAPGARRSKGRRSRDSTIRQHCRRRRIIPNDAGRRLDVSQRVARFGNPNRGAATAVALSLMGSLAWSGHAAGSPAPAGDIHRTADVLHLVAAGVWIGGLLALSLLFVLAMRHTNLASFRRCRPRRDGFRRSASRAWAHCWRPASSTLECSPGVSTP